MFPLVNMVTVMTGTSLTFSFFLDFSLFLVINFLFVVLFPANLVVAFPGSGRLRKVGSGSEGLLAPNNTFSLTRCTLSRFHLLHDFILGSFN